eukprot:m.169397 g.169397  ORF g.169397 m.169397 type:complete len:573 (+) comp38993_c0_seq1:611-2329(+)
MPACFSKCSRREFFDARKHRFDEDFNHLPEKGKCLLGVIIETVDGKKRPKLLFGESRLKGMESPKMEEFAAALRLAYHDNIRPEFVFRTISSPHPFAGRQYCDYNPDWMRWTALGKLMIEADIWMKLLASNVKPKPTNEGGFVPWNRNTNMKGGLKTRFRMKSERSSGSIFLVCKKVGIDKTGESLLFPEAPEMAIRADTSAQLSKYLTSIYDDIVFDGAPILERIRELPKMIVIAEWLKDKGVELDEEWLWDCTQPDESCIPQTFQSLKSCVDQTAESKAVALQGKSRKRAEKQLQSTLDHKVDNVLITPFGHVFPRVDHELSNPVTDGSRHTLDLVEYFNMGGLPLPHKSTVRASTNDDDIDWLYEGLDPAKIPIDETFLLPAVKSWSELHQQSINPFCSVLCSKTSSTSAVASYCGGCSMRSFPTEQVSTASRSAAPTRSSVTQRRCAGGGGVRGGYSEQFSGTVNPATGSASLYNSAGQRVQDDSQMRYAVRSEQNDGPVFAWGTLPSPSYASRRSPCTICRQEMNSGQVAVLECKHEFHEKCFDDWISDGKYVCPRCKRRLSAGRAA